MHISESCEERTLRVLHPGRSLDGLHRDGACRYVGGRSLEHSLIGSAAASDSFLFWVRAGISQIQGN